MIGAADFRHQFRHILYWFVIFSSLLLSDLFMMLHSEDKTVAHMISNFSAVVSFSKWPYIIKEPNKPSIGF